jgi:ribosome-associated protein
VRPIETIDSERQAYRRNPDEQRSKHLALVALGGALEKKALEPVLLDVRELASYTDHILLVSGRSDRQVMAISEGILEALAKENVRPIGTEGLKGGQWTLLDFGDVIVHVFYHPVRELYDLESFWVDAPRVPIDVPPEARIGAEEAYR